MITKNLFRNSMLLFLLFAFTILSCSKDDSDRIEQQSIDMTEVKLASEIDITDETISDIIITTYENQESNELNRASGSQSFLPSCVTITVVAAQGFREVTLDFGIEGCIVNGHLLRGQVVFSYTRNIGEQEVVITYDLINFYFNAKQVIGSRTIFRQLSNDNGNPQFTHTLDLTVIWPNGMQASREGIKIREWVEGFGSGVLVDNVFEVTGNWNTTFVNGNEHSHEVITPLRREVGCTYFVSGTVDVQRTNFGGTFDFGTGVCDDQATFTFNNGNTIDITLN